MRNKNCATIIVLVILLVLFFTGCLDLFKNNETIYSSHPTSISYTISYGYTINCTGNGKYIIKYDCDTPEVLKGSSPEIINIFGNNYENKTNIATFNDMKSWNISENGLCKDYKLGITANALSESFIVNDLNGENALSLDEIKNNHHDFIEQYCKEQRNETTVFIDPNNSLIKHKAYEIIDGLSSNNSFLAAKEIFVWLKKNTQYTTHIENNNVQTAIETYQLKTGDCDDLTFLYLSLCKSVDLPSRFIRGFLIEKNTAIPHAWAEVYVGNNIGNNGWIPVECAGETKNGDTDRQVHQNFALESADHLRIFTDDGSNNSLELSLSGISLMSDNNIIFEKTEFFTEIKNYQILEENRLSIDENNYRTYK